MRNARRDQLAVEHRTVGAAEIGDGIGIAAALDGRVVARGDAAVVLGEIEFGIMPLAGVAPSDLAG